MMTIFFDDWTKDGPGFRMVGSTFDVGEDKVLAA